jgi:N-acetylglucosamine-6-phosphate deacetylase
LAGDWLSRGGLDLQINGALGFAFPDMDGQHQHQLSEICQWLWMQGIDGFLPTIVTTSVAKIQKALAAFADFMDQQQAQIQPTNAAKVLGVHLEGPFLNRQKCGAHPPQHLQTFDVEHIKRVLGDRAEIVKMMTVAPELDPTGEGIAYLSKLGIRVSLGHSMATYEQANRAFQQGATLVTHAFNAMPGLHHREPGLLGAAMVHPHVKCGAIADGVHVCPTMLQILLRASEYQRGVFLVSDALAPLGCPDGEYPWDTRAIAVKNGTARLSDGTLAGTTLPLLAGVKNLVRWHLCDVETAIAMATHTPREALGEATIAPTQPATLLRWHWDTKERQLSSQRLLVDRQKEKC